ncbi:MAG: protein translocase subunit SecD [bacterium]|nr:protein translocase subunit SecD [bacterium]
MKSNWRLKAYLSLFLVLLSVYLLIPSIYDFRALREDAEAKGDQPPWYVKLFPDKQINLGLDLRGGIYLELEVVLTDALEQRAEITGGEIERYLKDEKIPYTRVQVLPDTTTIAVLLKNQGDVLKVKNYIRNFYGNNLQEDKPAPVLSFQFKDTPSELREGVFSQVNEWAKNQDAVADVLLQPNSLEVVLSKTDEAGSIRDAIGSQFGASLSYQDLPNAFYLDQSENYRDRLKDETVRQAVVTIRNRIDRHGVAEPAIQRLGENRVVVEMPGVRDPERAIALVKRAGKLEFKLVDESLKDPEVAKLVGDARKELNIPDEDFTLEAVDKINEALKGKIPAESEIAYEIQIDPVTKKIVGGTPFLLKRKVEVSGEMLRNAQVSVQNNEPYVSLSFNPTGTRIFGEVTAANVNKRLAILLDGTVNKAPVIRSAIPSGEAQITLGFGDYQALVREAEDLVVVLREGALPATLKEATKTIIGPSLGKTSIQRGFQATLLGGLVVMIFMALWYKGAGVLADFALVLNILFIFGVLTMFGATLTLPGVAGIVLTIGMAVDANVIILERIKEELALGKGVKAAVDSGYGNATSAIVDANITTFLAGIVLYQFGTGPVRGFAVTLMIGIATTLFTALVITRLFYDYRLSKANVTKISL